MVIASIQNFMQHASFIYCKLLSRRRSCQATAAADTAALSHMISDAAGS
jgi:hypothetical protein